MTEKSIYKDYTVFCLANTERENDQKYVARGPLGNNNISGELRSERASDLAKSIVDFHIEYLTGHPAIRQDAELTPFDCFDLNISYKSPYDIMLMDGNIYRTQELSSSERAEFLESLKTKYHECWNSD